MVRTLFRNHGSRVVAGTGRGARELLMSEGRMKDITEYTRHRIHQVIRKLYDAKGVCRELYWELDCLRNRLRPAQTDYLYVEVDKWLHSIAGLIEQGHTMMAETAYKERHRV